MSPDGEQSRAHRAWTEHQGFKMAKLFPADTESAVAELYFGELIWAYVSLRDIDEEATGTARIANARLVVEFWREPNKPTGVWDFNLDLAGALEQIERAQVWLLENESGRVASVVDPNTAAGSAFDKVPRGQQRRLDDGS